MGENVGLGAAVVVSIVVTIWIICVSLAIGII